MAQIIALFVLSVRQLRINHERNGIRYTTKTYNLFTVCVGGLTLIIPIVAPAYVFFGFADGIATAIDAKSCWDVSMEFTFLNRTKIGTDIL